MRHEVGYLGNFVSALAEACRRAVPVLAACTAACSEVGFNNEPTSSLREGIGGSGGSGASGGQTSVMLRNGLDTHVIENDSTNYWDDDRVWVRGTGSGSTQTDVGLLIWDMGVPPPVPCTVIFARIDLWVFNTSAQSYKLYPANRVWRHNQANWTLAQTGVSWQVPGANGAADRGTFFHEFTPSIAGSRSMVLNAAGRALVQSWVNEPFGVNKGLIIGHETHEDGFSFASMENPTISRRPTLVYQCQ